MRQTDANVLRAYIQMIVDGTAFTNWKNPPNQEKRNNIVNYILEGKQIKNFITNFQKAVYVSKDEADLKRMIDEMSIKEEEFTV